ncbi:MAG: STAS-like domain-containing protein [Candidatus Omnitrophota bacterium]|nr:STAS-like domain-containing protein [Candidatus Omnitrophota bacterium]
MKRIEILERAGSFSENKDIGRDIRMKEIMPALAKNEEVVLDFKGVESATQSFIHSLISDPIREYGDKALEHIAFKSCNDNIKEIIKIVVDYMQDAEEQNRQRS